MRNILHFILLISLFGLLNSFADETQKTENKKVDDIFNEEDYKSVLAKWHDLEILDEEDIETDERKHTADKAVNGNNKANKEKEHDTSSLPDPRTLGKEDAKIDDRTEKTVKENNKEHLLPELPDLGILDEEDIETDERKHTADKAVNGNNKANKEKEHDTSLLPDPKKVLDKETLEEKQERNTQKNTDQIKLPSEIDLSKKPIEISPPAQQITQELPKKQNSDPSNTDNNAANLQKDPQLGQRKESKLVVPQNKENTYKRDSKKRSTKRLEKPIVAKPQEDNERKKLQQWLELKRDPMKEWTHKKTQSKLIYKRQYDSLNEHLPTFVLVHDYSKQLFYCIKKNNLSCLRGIMTKLEKIGLNIEESLQFRNKLGDTPLIYAVKWGEIDMVRFLLLQGADLNAVNYNFQSAMNIAITKKYVDIVNAIAEMTPRLVEHKRINNKKDSTMYNWAINTKENNESKCDAGY